MNAKVVELQQQAIIIDGHCDILMPLTEGKMALGDRVEIPDPAAWTPPPGLERHPLVEFGFQPHTIYFGCMGQYDIPRFVAGGLTAQLCAIYLDDDKLANALHYGLQMVWHLHQAVAAYDNFELITTTPLSSALSAKANAGQSSPLKEVKRWAAIFACSTCTTSWGCAAPA